MPFQGSATGFILAFMVSVVLVTGGVRCSCAEACCSDHQPRISRASVSCSFDTGTHGRFVLIERGCHSADRCCEKSGPKLITSKPVKAELADRMSLTVTSDYEALPTYPTPRLSQPEGIRRHRLAGESLLLLKCSFLS